MVATSAHHIVRVTVRVSVVAFHRDIDVTLPTSSTLAEVLPELARLVELPEVHRPWEATTAAGAPLGLLHLGLYAYRRDFLLGLDALPPSPLEQAERLEQLRVLEAGFPIAVGLVDEPSVGVDTPEDYRRFVERWRSRPGRGPGEAAEGRTAP